MNLNSRKLNYQIIATNLRMYLEVLSLEIHFQIEDDEDLIDSHDFITAPQVITDSCQDNCLKGNLDCSEEINLTR